MALDFHRLDNKDFLFALDDREYDYLSEIFDSFTHWTGLIIDQYDKLKLTTENQETLIKIIDKYIDTTDLNKDKKKTSAILEFKGLINLFLNKKVDLELLGD
jgi:hypothetical protein